MFVRARLRLWFGVVVHVSFALTSSATIKRAPDTTINTEEICLQDATS